MRPSRILRTAVTLLILLALMFVPAGRLDWGEGWLFLGAYLAWTTAMVLWMRRADPGLYAERQRSASHAEGWDRVVLSLIVAGYVATVVVSGLDSGRFGWSRVPLGARLAAWAVLLGAMALVAWTMRTNTYLSGWARIQRERGHRVVVDGPYRGVRHPMYVGAMVASLALPLVLGSWWGLVPTAAVEVAFVLRTALEDRMLRRELAGYQAYASRVRWRLLPGVW